MVSTLPAHQKGVKGQTLAAQGRQGGTETRWDSDAADISDDPDIGDASDRWHG